MNPLLLVAKLALAAAERGDAEAASEGLRGLIGMIDGAKATPVAPAPLRAVSRVTLAEMLGCTPEHVGNLVRRGEIPSSAILGTGRGARFLVADVLDAMRVKPSAPVVAKPDSVDAIESEGAALVRARGRLRVVRVGT